LEKHTLILGSGLTGLSAANYLFRRNKSFILMDNRLNPSGLKKISEITEDFEFINEFDTTILNKISEIVVSPGVPANNKVLKEARFLNIPVFSDLELFLSENSAIKILITGTNGKTTVSLMTELLFKSFFPKKNIEAIGNIGKPVLDFIDSDLDISIIEVSSFHLELSSNISSEISVLLNIGQDHLDRHSSQKEYKLIKEKIYSNSDMCIGSQNPETEDIQYKSYEEELFGFNELIDSSLSGWPLHEKKNFKASVYILYSYLILTKNLEFFDDPALQNLIFKSLEFIVSFKRPPNRFEYLGIKNGVLFINDSKATNISSTLAALRSIENNFGLDKTYLICGGDLKGQNILEFKEFPDGVIKKAFIFGKDRSLIKNGLKNITQSVLKKDLNQALLAAKKEASKDNIILLSPACSSTDMFIDYQERGNAFKKLSGF
jgi:UDP-N-acetylmuramoylalanine--D-glutamate ligase|tara:strand:+ start:156 stop:1457 length:1302 start_codon:yes stop_codon:yes gene_type:complete